MKKNVRALIAVAVIVLPAFVVAADKNAKSPNSPPAAPKKAEAAPMADLVGEWEMVGFIVDTNDNLQIDEAERAQLKKPSVKDYMKLNRDGTGEFTVAELPGRYEVGEADARGRRSLAWFDKSNGRHRVGTILKVTKDELHLKEPGGHGLFLWKRK